MKAAFWVSAFVVAYVYVGYPLLLAAWTRLRPAGSGIRRGETIRPGGLPFVSVVLAARNEGHQLERRLENLLSQDYPADRLEIVVVSDGSTDSTAQVAARYAPRVRFIALPPAGKALALNAGVREARHPILVFADARQRFAPDAVRRLVAPFADPRIGGVSGELHLAEGCERADVASGGGTAGVASGQWPVASGSRVPQPEAERCSSSSPANGADAQHATTGVGEGVGLYWAYEKWIRRQESTVGSVVGATGAIYALRRAAWKDLPTNAILDDVLTPMRAVLAGYRVVFEPRARAFDTAPDDAGAERVRKTRTLAGNYQLLRLEPRLLVPGLNPVWLQFVSHKIGRLVVPHALVILLVSNTALASAGPLYSLALILQVAFYVLALHGATLALAPAHRQRQARHTPVAAAADLDAVDSRARKEWMNASLD